MPSSDGALSPSLLPTQESGSRRKSRRVVRKPELLTDAQRNTSPLSNGSAKRKRQPNGHGLLDQEDEGSDDEDLVDESDGSADEEELKEKKRQARKNKALTGPSTKRPRISNGTGAALAIRSVNVASRNASQKSKVQHARSRQSQVNQQGLYAEVFGRGQSGEDAAAGWFQRYQQNSVDAMCEMVNFVLQCTGCEAKVTLHDIEDVDNVTNKLGDLQSEYREAPIVDYPLISKQKQYTAFRPVLIDFFSALIKTVHQSSSLYEDAPLFENIQTWVDTMSSAAIRPFRHTATLVSLTMSTALCQVARDLELAVSMSRRQAEAESKKKKVNQARVKSIQQKINADEDKLANIESILKDEFDVVFVHRYRDVDPKIRVECVTAIGTWILTYRKMFLEGQYLRYLGWVLSDTAAQTRAEVVKQLRFLFKNPANIGPLRGFTDRFRPRMVEIATRDAEPGVRADAIDLLDKLRDAELLEPDDIDTVGRLIFDSEARVRKAVGKFFVSNLEDLYKASVEPVGHEQLDSTLPEHYDSDNYLDPARPWIKFKCLAESLGAYDGNDQESPGDKPAKMLIAANMDSRYMLATQAIFPHMDELQEWESLAGYLLYDHSSIMSTADDADSAAALQGVYKLGEGEESILLEVLDYAVKLYLIQNTESQTEGKKKGRKTQASKDHTQEIQEAAARHLTMIIPQLLNKYGSVPQAASAILRLQHLLDVDLINELQTTKSTYSVLLDDINKQFMTHSDRGVLAEASVALLKAKASEPAKEAADTKTQEMWEEMLSTLQTLCGNQNVDGPGTLPSSLLTEISNIMSRLSNLAAISDCTLTLETPISTPLPQRGRKSQGLHSKPLDLLLQLCRRGRADEELDEDVASLEDDLVMSVMKTLLFYFMWKVQSLRASISANTVRHLERNPDLFTDLAARRDTFAETLSEIAGSRLPLDPLRLFSLSTSMDLYTLFSTLRHAKPAKESQPLPATIRSGLDQHLISIIPTSSQTSIMQSHDRLERFFAKKSRRKLAPPGSSSVDDQLNNTHNRNKPQRREPAEDDLPIDSDSDASETGDVVGHGDDDDSNGDDGAMDGSLGQGRDARKAAVLLAEQNLCEFTGKLVLAVLAEVMAATVGGAVRASSDKYRERLLRNKVRLGNNYKEVLAYLLEPRETRNKPKKQNKAKRTAPPAVDAKAAIAGKEVVKPVATAAKAGKGGSGSGDKGRSRKSEPVVLSEDDIEDEEMEGQDGDDEEHGHGHGLDEEEEEEAGNAGDDVEGDDHDDDQDDVMGD